MGYCVEILRNKRAVNKAEFSQLISDVNAAVISDDKIAFKIIAKLGDILKAFVFHNVSFTKHSTF